MSEVVRDIGKVWDRLFDHKGFLTGEINFALKEFEQKRGETEIDHLFSTIENITEIKDTHINRFKEANEKLIGFNQQLSEALNLTRRFSELEEKYAQSLALEDNRNKRKDVWEKFMDNITSDYSKINAEFEEAEAESRKVYEDLQKKLVL